jgi:hypothetical protein
MASTKSRSDEFQAGRGKRKPQSADARSPLKQFFGGPMNTLQNGVYYEKYPRVAPTYNDDDDYAESSYDGEPHFSPGPAQAEQGYDPRPRYETASVGGSRTRRSFVRKSLRFILCGLVIAGISAAAFASQYGDPETVQTLKAIRKTLSADLGIPSSLSTTSLLKSLRAAPAVQDRSILEETPRPPTIADENVQRQLDTIAADIAGVRSLVQQLAGSQTKVATQIAAMKAANDSPSDRTWWLIQSATFVAPASKSHHKTLHDSLSSTGSVRP